MTVARPTHGPGPSLWSRVSSFFPVIIMWRLVNKGIPLGESALGRLDEAEGKTLFRCPSMIHMLWLKVPRRSLGSARRNDIVNSFLSSDLADSSLNLAPSAAADMSCP